MQKYSLLLMDLDGTLLDFDKSEHLALENCFKRYNIDMKNIDLYAKINENLWKEHEKGNIKQDELKVLRFDDFLSKINRHDVNANEISDMFIHELGKGKYIIKGAIDFLEELYKDYIIAYITNGLSIVQRERLDENPISKYAKAVYISEELKYSKPHPYMVELAMKDFNIDDKSKVLIIGDSETSDIQAAINSGVDSLYLNFKNNNVSTNATYTAFNYSQALKIISK